ncbi:MAG: hypothetical protein U9P44_03320 [archaeon]|nr:hypothetical protein [archaeon]
MSYNDYSKFGFGNETRIKINTSIPSLLILPETIPLLKSIDKYRYTKSGAVRINIDYSELIYMQLLETRDALNIHEELNIDCYPYGEEGMRLQSGFSIDEDSLRSAVSGFVKYLNALNFAYKAELDRLGHSLKNAWIDSGTELY